MHFSRTPTADVGKKSPSADISDFAFRDGTPIIDSSNMDISYGSSVGEQASSAVAGQQYAKQNSSQPPAANFLPPPTTMAEVLDRIAILTNPRTQKKNFLFYNIFYHQQQ